MKILLKLEKKTICKYNEEKNSFNSYIDAIDCIPLTITSETIFKTLFKTQKTKTPIINNKQINKDF